MNFQKNIVILEVNLKESSKLLQIKQSQKAYIARYWNVIIHHLSEYTCKGGCLSLGEFSARKCGLI